MVSVNNSNPNLNPLLRTQTASAAAPKAAQQASRAFEAPVAAPAPKAKAAVFAGQSAQQSDLPRGSIVDFLA